ncbi:MAG: DegQ family serine endoprotease [Sedimentisphaerales bacterium]|nr:DegQ family serine endoprotease [Sedimentisphaerales bacterium]
MGAAGLKSREISLKRFVFCTFVLSVLLLPAFAAAEEKSSIDALRQIGKAFADTAEKASPAVVGIVANQLVTREYTTMPNWPFGDPFDRFGDDFFEHFFRGLPRQRQQQQRKYQLPVQASGFIVSADGHILTNNHVIKDAEDVTVKLLSGKEYSAKVIGTDPDSDVALIKIDANNLSYLKLADSDKLEVGQWVLAIGNPFGLSHTVTAGIVSAKGRGIGLTGYENFIQTDAAINFGNSGGPLIDLDGKVVGINTAIYGPGGNIGIGFAIPINTAKFVYNRILTEGTVTRGFLGVTIQNLTPDLAAALGLDEDTKGVLVPDVNENKAAEKAGVKPYDIIVEFNGEQVETDQELQNRVAMEKPGTKAEIVVLRDGKRKTLTVTLGTRGKAEQIATEAEPEVLEKLGFSVQDLTEELAAQLGYEGQKGVVVNRVEPGSQAQRKGIASGVLIMEVNQTEVKNIKDFRKAIEKAAEKGSAVLRVRNQSGVYFVLLRLDSK